MVELVIVYWRDIPAQILIGRGRKAAKRPLSERFEQAIDRAAMKSGASDTDAYLADWRKSEPIEVEGEPHALADEWSAKLEEEYNPDRLHILVKNDGRDPNKPKEIETETKIEIETKNSAQESTE